MIVNNEPDRIIGGADRAGRFECIAFSPTGDLRAVADADHCLVHFFPRTGRGVDEYESAPCAALADDHLLNFVHGVDFSPDGRFIVVVARDSDALSLFRRQHEPSVIAGPTPLWTMRRATHGLCNPSSVAFHPTARNLLVANRMRNPAIAYYVRVPGGDGAYGFNPARSVPRDVFTRWNLPVPHSVAYSPDGRWLAVCHSTYFRDRDKRGRAALSLWRWDESSNRLDLDRPVVVREEAGFHPHCAVFHPHGRIIAMTREEGAVSFFRFTDSPGSLEEISRVSVPVERHRQGARGVAFRKSGEHAEITDAGGRIRIHCFDSGQSRRRAAG